MRCGEPLAPSETFICRPFAYVMSFMRDLKRLTNWACGRNKLGAKQVSFLAAPGLNGLNQAERMDNRSGHSRIERRRHPFDALAWNEEPPRVMGQ